MSATEDARTRDEGTGGQNWIARLLQFDRDGDTFVAANPQHGQRTRLFGGLIAAQALRAAGETVDAGKRPQSLHLYFVRGGRYDVDVELQVERTRTGRSFDTRRVTAVQDGEVILEMIASFHRPEPGADWHPHAEPTIALQDAAPKHPSIEFADRFEIRTMPGDSSPFAVPPYWIRARDPIGDEPLVCACTLTLMSDLGPVPAARPPGTPATVGAGFATSLDHSVWFHRAFRPNEWHRYEVRSVNNSDSRGLATGSLYDMSGSLIASTTQEALWRV
jgi:acyl-CoA thioesterase